jgi:hypothetical protein
VTRPARETEADKTSARLVERDRERPRVLARVPAEPDAGRVMEGGPQVPTYNPRYVQLLCKLYVKWSKKQEPST